MDNTLNNLDNFDKYKKGLRNIIANDNAKNSVVYNPSFTTGGQVPFPTVAAQSVNKILHNPVNINVTSDIKIQESHPGFLHSKYIDEIFTSKVFGGVLEIIECKWDVGDKSGIVACLLKTWGVVALSISESDFVGFVDEDKIKEKLNSLMLSFDDVEEYYHWSETGQKELRDIKDEKEAQLKNIKNLEDFFSGDLDKIESVIS